MKQETFDKAYTLQWQIEKLKKELTKFDVHFEREEKNDGRGSDLELKFYVPSEKGGNFNSHMFLKNADDKDMPIQIGEKVKEIIDTAVEQVAHAIRKQIEKLEKEFSKLKDE